MKKMFQLAILLLVGFTTMQAQDVKVSAYYNVPTAAEDSVLYGLVSIRGANYHSDLLGDGSSAIVVTNYKYRTVSVFATVGNDAIELKWTSPPITTGGIYTSSSPRTATFGDLDNDGLNEVIVPVDPQGVAIYEWDGVAGSWNFGTQPSQIINLESLVGTTNGNIVEYIECRDVDGDGKNELYFAANASGSGNDGYFVISSNGNWITNSPGFSSFNLEAKFIRGDYTAWGLGGGSPYAVHAVNFDGTGNPELMIHNWNLKNVVPVVVPNADTYNIADTTNGNQNYFLGGDADDVALFAGVAADVDGDGREELYLPTYPASGPNGDYPGKGVLHMVSYNDGEPTNEISAVNVTALAMGDTSGFSQFGIGYGDLDDDGNTNIYIGGGKGSNIMSAEFLGGDKRDVNNWEYSVIYRYEPDIYDGITIKDSAGVIDTSYSVNGAFVSKLYAHDTDFDNDGNQDIIMPYQGLNDSTSITNLTWNGSSFDTLSHNILNPKKWGLRILESDFGTGVKSKEVTIIMPSDYKLEQNYPNPFNPTTKIEFSLPSKNQISITVYDILGREVKSLLSNQEFNAGSFQVEWDGTNNFGSRVTSGNYIYTMKFGNFQISKKMTLLK